MVLGGLLGAAVGAGIAYQTFEPRYGAELGDVYGCIFTGCQPSQHQSNSREERTLTGAWLGAAAGGLLGWAVGRSVWSWSRVEVSELGVSSEGIAVSLDYRLPNRP